MRVRPDVRLRDEAAACGRNKGVAEKRAQNENQGRREGGSRKLRVQADAMKRPHYTIDKIKKI